MSAPRRQLRSRRACLRLLAASPLGLLAVACGASSMPNAPAATRPLAPTALRAATAPLADAAAGSPMSKVVYAQAPAANVARFDPGAAVDSGSAKVFWPTFDALTWLDGSGTVQPGLATSWKTLDPTTWEFALGAYRFHNGRSVEAQDVVDTFARYRDPTNKLAALAIFVNVNHVQAVDAATVRVTTKVADPTLPNVLSLAFVLPMQELKARGEDAFFQQPFGSGPFKINKIDFSGTTAWTAMGSDWVTPQGVPHVKDMEWRFISDAAVQVAALKSGDVDVIVSIQNGDVVPDLQKAGFKISSRQGVGTTSVWLNPFSDPTSDVRVRQAINYAVDKQAIVTALWAGYGATDGQLLGPNALGYNPNLQTYPYDEARARQLLADAGRSSGFTLQLTTSTASVNRKEIGEAIASYLEKVQIKSDIRVVDLPQWFAGRLGPPDKRPGLWLDVLEWGATFEAGSAWRWFSSDISLESGRRWVDDTFERMFQEARNTFDRDQRGKLYQAAGKYLHDQAPHLFLTLPKPYAAHSARVSLSRTPESEWSFTQDQFVAVKVSP